MALYMADRRNKRRALLIEMSGGKCVKCEAVEELNFDHRNPKERSFRLNGKDLDGAWQKIINEWGKCQLLCRACHVRKTKENGEYPPAWNKGISRYGDMLPEHGCEAAYAAGCRCEKCREARYRARIRRGETSGKRCLYVPRKLYGEQRAVNT